MLSSKIPKWLGFAAILLLVFILYYQFFLFGKIPMPGDTIIGAYFPWLDYKWGFSTGVPVKNALISDIFSQFFVWKYLIVDIFKQGQIPLWNIYSLSGTPLLATYHSAVFNPFGLLLFFPTLLGWGLYISMQTFLAMLGMFLLLGVYVKNIWARILGAVVFSISGLMTTWTEFGTGVYAAAMIPWIFLFLEKYLISKKLRHLFLMSLSFVILYLSGHAQLTLYSTILVSAYLLIKCLKQKDFKIIFIPGIFIVLAGLFCAFQFLPTIEFTKESIRSNEAYSSSFNYGLNPIYETVKLFSADFFGNPSTNNYWDSQSYHEQSMFLGTIPFILILSIIIFEIRRKKINFWIGLFLTSLILGFDNILTRLIYSLPLPFITYSSAARIFFLTSFSGAILAALALENLKDQKFSLFLRRINFYFLGALIGIFLGFICLIYFAGQQSLTQEVVNYKVTIKNLILPIGISLVSLILIIVLRKKPKVIVYSVLIILAISFIDLSRYFYKYNPFFASNLIFPSTPAIEYLQNQKGLFRIARLDSEILPPNTWTFYKLQSIEGYDPLISENYARLFNLVKSENYQSTLSRYREIDDFNPKYLNALNVKYLLSVKRDERNNVKGGNYNPELEKYGYKIVFEDGNSVISENPYVLPRAYFASKLQILESKEALVSIISSEIFDPAKEALILDQINVPEVSGQGEVEITSYTPNKIEFKTRTKNDEFLIFADTFNKGWKLYRNGTEDKIYETNIALRGIVVPSGENSFIMEYLPDSFKYGIYISMTALFGFMIILIYSIRKKKI